METQWYIHVYDPDEGGTGGGDDGFTQLEADAVDWTDGLVLVPQVD